MKIIPYGKQFIDDKDILSVTKALKRDKLTTGDLVEKFETKIKKFVNCKYSTTCNSGTSAIFLALMSIDVKKNDIIIMPAINFISSYNVSKLFGAKIYLADVNKFTGQMMPENVSDCCKKFKLKKVKAIITMYNGGNPQSADLFYKFKNKLNCYIIEDACHALGSEYEYKKKTFKIGSCKHADISTFSLHPLKTITTGEGGIVTTNSKKLNDKIKKHRSLGIKRDSKDHWKYDVVYQGFNFRLTDFQCALGMSQLKKIGLFISSRSLIAKRYTDNLSQISQIYIPKYDKNYKSSHHLYLIHLKKGNLSLKKRLINYMKKNNIILQYHYIPIYKFKIFQDLFKGTNAEQYYKTTISLPIYYGLNSKIQNYITEKLKLFFEKSKNR